MDNPYESATPTTDSSSPPQVILWFHVYAALMAFMYLSVSVAVVGLVAFSEELSKGADTFSIAILLGAAVFTLGLGFVFMLPMLVPQRPWVWVYCLILICIGMTSICTLPASIPLLIFWLKPNVKQYYA